MARVKKRKPDLRRIRPSKTYTLPAIAKALDRDIATVRSWVREGLPLLSDQNPVLVFGSDLKDWLQFKQKARKRKCQLGELFCFKCKQPRKPLPGSVVIIPRNEKTVSIKGQCSVCGTKMNQVGSMSKMVELENRFRTFTPQMQNLTGYSNPSDRHTSMDHAAEGEGQSSCVSTPE